MGWRMNDAHKPVCLRGHAFTDENTRWYRGGRVCRQCRALHERRRRQLGITTLYKRRRAAKEARHVQRSPAES